MNQWPPAPFDHIEGGVRLSPASAAAAVSNFSDSGVFGESDGTAIDDATAPAAVTSKFIKSLLLKVGDPVPVGELAGPTDGSVPSPAGWNASGWLAGITCAEDNSTAPPGAPSETADVLRGWRAIHAASLGHWIPVLDG